MPTDHLPLVGEDRIEPRVVGTVADGVVVEIRHRLVQVVQHLRLPFGIRVQHVARQVQRQRHGIAVVVVGHVLAPVDERRPVLVGVGEVPAVDIDLAVAPVDLDDRRDERNHPVPDFLDIRAFVDGQPIDQLHECGRRPRFGRVDGAGDVVHRHRLIDELVRFGVVQADRARVGELGQPSAILGELAQVRFGRHRHGQHLPAFFGFPDRVHLHPRARLLDHPEVLIDLVRVGEFAWRAGDVAKHDLRRRHRFRGRKIVDERRGEERLRRVFLELLGIGLVHRLFRVADVGIGGRLHGAGRAGQGDQSACQDEGRGSFHEDGLENTEHRELRAKGMLDCTRDAAKRGGDPRPVRDRPRAFKEGRASERTGNDAGHRSLSLSS